LYSALRKKGAAQVVHELRSLALRSPSQQADPYVERHGDQQTPDTGSLAERRHLGDLWKATTRPPPVTLPKTQTDPYGEVLQDEV